MPKTDFPKLSGVPYQLTSEECEDFERRIEKKEKYKCIGSGSFANVYARKGENQVLKIGNNPDDPWVRFAHKALVLYKTRPNPWLPVIHDIAFFEKEPIKGQRYGDTYYVATMERLTRVPETEFSDSKANYIATLTDNMDYRAAIHVLKAIGVDPLFIEAMKLVSKLCLHGYVDLHSGNIMMRGKQLVITDPLAI